jgi:hypothetical protein
LAAIMRHLAAAAAAAVGIIPIGVGAVLDTGFIVSLANANDEMSFEEVASITCVRVCLRTRACECVAQCSPRTTVGHVYRTRFSHAILTSPSSSSSSTSSSLFVACASCVSWVVMACVQSRVSAGGRWRVPVCPAGFRVVPAERRRPGTFCGGGGRVLLMMIASRSANRAAAFECACCSHPSQCASAPGTTPASRNKWRSLGVHCFRAT